MDPRTIPPATPPTKRWLTFGILSGSVVGCVVIGFVAYDLLRHNSRPAVSPAVLAPVHISSATTSRTACQLFTPADAAAVMGASAKAGATVPPTKLPDAVETSCSYSGKANVMQVELTASTATTVDAATKAYDSFENAAPGATAVSSLGDRAFYFAAGDILYVQKGAVVLGISSTTTAPQYSETVDRQIATAMLANFQ